MITITFNTDSAAFDGFTEYQQEINYVLAQARDRIQAGDLEVYGSFKLKDFNGNTVGKVEENDA